MLRIFHNTRYDFIRYWRHGIAVPLALILAGLAAFAITGPIPSSIEFTGGTLVQVEFAEPVDVGDIRATLNAAGVGGAEIQSFGSRREYTIRAQDPEEVEAQAAEGAATVAERVANALEARFGADAFTIERAEAVGPRVGDELRRNAAIAVLLSFLITLIYLAIRFEWRFGVAAVAATAHDVVTTIAFLKLMNIEISLTVVAAILTVIGYSLNDTIIVFDRVRENLRKKRRESLRDTLNRSLNETLPRTVMTHLTTLAATLALLFFAGPVIRPFAWVMTFGIFTGTFSSMFIAGPLLIWIERRWPRGVEATGGVGPRRREREERPASGRAEPVSSR